MQPWEPSASAGSGNAEGEGAARTAQGVPGRTRRPGHEAPLPPAAGPACGSPAAPAVNLRRAERIRAAQRRERRARISAPRRRAASGRAGHTCQAQGGGALRYFVFSLVFRWVVALEEFGEISGALAWLGFPKSTLKFRWSLLSLTRQGPIMWQLRELHGSFIRRPCTKGAEHSEICSRLTLTPPHPPAPMPLTGNQRSPARLPLSPAPMGARAAKREWGWEPGPASPEARARWSRARDGPLGRRPVRRRNAGSGCPRPQSTREVTPPRVAFSLPLPPELKNKKPKPIPQNPKQNKKPHAHPHTPAGPQRGTPHTPPAGASPAFPPHGLGRTHRPSSHPRFSARFVFLAAGSVLRNPPQKF